MAGLEEASMEHMTFCNRHQRDLSMHEIFVNACFACEPERWELRVNCRCWYCYPRKPRS